MYWTKRRERFRGLAAGDQCVHPGSVYDPISARIAVSAPNHDMPELPQGAPGPAQCIQKNPASIAPNSITSRPCRSSKLESNQPQPPAAASKSSADASGSLLCGGSVTVMRIVETAVA